MNPLIDKFPTKIKVDSEVVDINCDFRNCLKIILAFEDDDLTTEEKYDIMLARLYKTIPKNKTEAVVQAVKFLDCGKKVQENNNEKRMYSFKKDASFIFSSMSSTHNIDLNEIPYLHWWKFVYLFLDIKKDCTFSNILYYRQKANSGKLDKNEREVYRRSYKILSLNSEETDDTSEEEDEFMKKFNS